MDPFSQIIKLLKPQAIFWRVVEANDAWTISFRPTNIVVFGQLIEGTCHVEREDGICLDLEAGDFLLMAAPPNWTMNAFGGGTVAVDFQAVIENPGLLHSSARTTQVTRFMAGNFAFSAANRDLISTLMLPIVVVRGKEITADRLGALLATFGDEVTGDRPGRSLILDRLLELILIEALRYRPADIGDGRSSLLAGLADPKIGNALRLMHSDPKQPWTLAAIAHEVGMSRSAFASRFAELVGIPPIEYLSNWRMTLAKSALVSSEMPMIDIAEMAGYQSVSAFSSAFKRETGLSPTVYVKSLQVDSPT
ncbi:MAG: AraC family transcriptional regulator [Cyanobacteria bacterium REEB67]|nr:AraC family transcriptional regulator [Cyanobacteria bacterium REEB67]